VDLAKLPQRSELTAEITRRYPETKLKAVLNRVSQVWPHAYEMQKGDLVVLQLKTLPAVYISEMYRRILHGLVHCLRARAAVPSSLPSWAGLQLRELAPQGSLC
jgi:hypothetical protein